MQIAVLMNEYNTISMPAIAKQTIKSLDGVLKLDAINPKQLAEKYSPRVAAYMSDPKRLISSLNPLLLIVICVIVMGAVVAVVSVCTTKLKNRLPERIIKVIDRIKAKFMFNILISSLQTGYLNLWISTNLKIFQNIKDYRIFAIQKSHRTLSDEEPMHARTFVTNTLMTICLASGLIASLVLIIRLIKRHPLEYFDLEETK